ncbi:TRAP transporter permease DctQ [Parazoarcus communis]|uniref:TRAP transporter small permease protein n=1 Tax=Parazoarcus communis TaxID=41977 RepID=A0A2U8GKN8_9RHOO|nr:TRAP transporter small permease [Parazoarcus communis]AWI74127.1 TRAP transporter permease DctQ [Parazoarcus communis]
MDEAPKQGLILQILRRIDHGLAVLEKQLLAWAIILMAVNTLGNVVARVGFNSSLFFSEELNQFLIVLITFVGTSAAARQGRHIRMSAFTDMLPVEYRRWALAAIQAFTAVVLALLAWYATTYILRTQAMGRVTPALQFPMWITLLWIPLGLAIATLQFWLTALVNMRTPGSVHVAPGIREHDEIDMPTI